MEDVIAKDVAMECEELEDTPSEASTEGRSPITILDSTSVTSEESVTPEDEPPTKFLETEKPVLFRGQFV